jgi:Predicted signal transduction protein with a C-terminal ATPase domain
MNHFSFRQKLLGGFLVIGIVPLLVCTLLMLNIFRFSLNRNAEDTAQSQITAMTDDLTDFLTDCEEVMVQLRVRQEVIQALDGSTGSDAQDVYSTLYDAASPLLHGANLSIYDRFGQRIYSTASQLQSAALPVRWGLLSAATGSGVVYRRADPLSKSSACMQAACAVRSRNKLVGYVVMDMTAAHFEALFDGKHSATSGLLLLDPFWDQIYATADIPFKTLAARLREQLLSGEPLSDERDEYDYYVLREFRSGSCLIFRQPRPMAEWMTQLLYLVAGLSILLCLGLCVAVSMRFSHQLFEPIRALNSAMREVEEGNLDIQIDNHRTDEMGQLSGRFNRMTQRLRQNLEDSLHQQRELNAAQVRMMQAQLNPHFLYNTLDTIKWMGKIHQAPEIATISADLADILRNSISADEFVPLRQELKLVERYVEIQSIRFSGAFLLLIEVDEVLQDVLVPKLMLQPLVENAIVHGFGSRDSGEISISAQQSEKALCVMVRDNGRGIPEEALRRFQSGGLPDAHSHLGLYNVDAILRLHYGAGFGLRFIPAAQGTCICITLPISGKGEDSIC